MEKLLGLLTIVLVGVILLLCLRHRGYKYYSYKERKYAAKKLSEYNRKRSAFYKKERERVIRSLRKQVASGNMSKAQALVKAQRFLCYYSGDEAGWKSELKSFEDELKKEKVYIKI